MTLTGNQIRKKFLDYFVSHDHEWVKSASLIPQNDPTLYFTNAGMVPFKNIFTGQEKSLFSRATSSQKCMRVSGKHNDLENVGRTARHHTFFEMLGNFSFGDYFKKEAIRHAWDFLTKTLPLPKDKLWITVFQDDDEALELWRDDIGIEPDRIVKMGEKDNFWSMGETGPCGPCSEIHYDQEIPCTLNNPDCEFGKCECDRYIEIWNLVFMQFERHADGSKTPLPKPSIDTGMGLERLAAVLQGKKSNYDCDLFTPLIDAIQKIVQKKYGDNEEDNTSMRVLADHIRSSVFLISDGVLPSNEGRGYILRRILRRAIRHGKLLGQTHPFFHRLVSVVVKEMSQAYPDLKSNQETIKKVIHAEEERFLDTLEKGLKLLALEIERHKKLKSKTLSGEVAFKLYDTFGFPLDLTEIIAAEHDMTVDNKGFDTCMTEQKERARAGWKGTGEDETGELYFQLSEKLKTKFLGYETMESPANVNALIQGHQTVDQVSEGEFEIVLNQTPFYAESGGQIGDKGVISNDSFEAIITDTQRPAANLIVHKAKIKKGSLKNDSRVQLQVFKHTRKPTMRNHTATHIMHAALRKILGSHVRQAGSYVDDKVLRFDFSHFEAIETDLLQKIEDEVNKVIFANEPVTKNEMSYDQAIEKGALAFFGEKYADQVRVVSVGDYSAELCGGTHLDTTSEIGCFKILSEGSIAAGVRRIEAITGLNAVLHAREQSNIIDALTDELKAQPQELPDKINKLKARNKALEKEIEKLNQKMMQNGSNDILKDAFDVNGTRALVYHSDNPQNVRELATTIRGQIKSGIAVITAKAGPKAIVCVAVTPDMQKNHPANKILGPLAELVDGRGGGKPDMAQAGGTNPDGLEHIREKLIQILQANP